jgi:hypothetical protein
MHSLSTIKKCFLALKGLINRLQNFWQLHIFWNFLHKPWHNNIFKIIKKIEFFLKTFQRIFHQKQSEKQVGAACVIPFAPMEYIRDKIIPITKFEILNIYFKIKVVHGIIGWIFLWCMILIFINGYFLFLSFSLHYTKTWHLWLWQIWLVTISTHIVIYAMFLCLVVFL